MAAEQPDAAEGGSAPCEGGHAPPPQLIRVLDGRHNRSGASELSMTPDDRDGLHRADLIKGTVSLLGLGVAFVVWKSFKHTWLAEHGYLPEGMRDYWLPNRRMHPPSGRYPG